MPYNYTIYQKAVWEIESFYINVAAKYRHTYSILRSFLSLAP